MLYLPRGCSDKARNSDEWHKNTEQRILQGVTELMVEKVLGFVANYDGCAEGDAAPFARNQKVVRQLVLFRFISECHESRRCNKADSCHDTSPS